MPDFLLELRSEEIPARMQAKAETDLARLFTEQLTAAGLKAEAIETYSTPRRLALIARGLPIETEATREERKGPSAGAPAQAIEGFLRSTGLTRDQLIEREDKKGVTLFAVIEKPGRATASVLAEAIPTIIRAFPWPKSMRWGDASASTESPRWVRPLQGIVALLGEDIVECQVAGVTSGAATVGHRFHHPGIITIGSANDYAEKLRACHVIIDPAERRRIIAEGARAAAAAAGLNLVEDDGLLAENAGLTEWPVPLLGRFDPSFLEVPREVIQLTMRTNQKYFALTKSSPSSLGEGDHAQHGGGAGAAAELAPNFICTANIEASDGGASIVAGNEKVLAARLSDAKFFWEQDLKIPLEEQAKKLEQIVFHEKLGTVADKVDRVAKLAKWLVEEGIIKSSPSLLGEGASMAKHVPGEHADRAADAKHPGAQHGGGAAPPSALRAATSPSKLGEDHDLANSAKPVSAPAQAGAQSPAQLDPRFRGGTEELAGMAETAARLCKADLVTGMVGEFPELQGIIGGYLARAQGHSKEIANAIRDHYKPVGQGDEVPTDPVTVAVSLADKLDTLFAFFAEGLLPTGSKDPFALRRAALGVLHLLQENSLRFLVFEAERSWSRDGRVGPGLALTDFLHDRLGVQLRDGGVRYDYVQASTAWGSALDGDLLRVKWRAESLHNLLRSGDGRDLLAGYKRAANILKKEGWTDAEQKPLSYTPEKEEAELISALDAAEPKAQAAVVAEDFGAAMAALASLRGPVDAFFDKVIVNDPDPDKREARLALLARMRDAVHRVADFSRIEG